MSKYKDMFTMFVIYVLHIFMMKKCFNSLPTECSLLITFANNLDPDQVGKMWGLIWIQSV